MEKNNMLPIMPGMRQGKKFKKSQISDAARKKQQGDIHKLPALNQQRNDAYKPLQWYQQFVVAYVIADWQPLLVSQAT